jgi:class 3 adenylate cyclase
MVDALGFETMVECASCGADVAEGARFCPGCGTPVSAPTPAPREERRVVTSLFCDLVGFTAMSEDADPEEVDGALASYFKIAREAVERHGGVVEKFIVDAVFAIFGAPVAHRISPQAPSRRAAAGG